MSRWREWMRAVSSSLGGSRKREKRKPAKELLVLFIWVLRSSPALLSEGIVREGGERTHTHRWEQEIDSFVHSTANERSGKIDSRKGKEWEKIEGEEREEMQWKETGRRREKMGLWIRRMEQSIGSSGTGWQITLCSWPHAPSTKVCLQRTKKN